MTAITDLDKQIASVHSKINQFDKDIRHCVEEREWDPFKYDFERTRLAALRQVEVERLSILMDRRRNETPAGGYDSWRPASSGYFHGSDH
jgi:hypothetical protein